MALHNTYGDFNRRGDTLPVVKYSATPYHFDFYGQNVIACWICKRTSSFDFEYFGMDEATAQQCANALRDIYTRRYMRWTATVTSKDSTDKPNVVITPTYNFECTSEIQPRLVAGDNWSVNVSVRDEDTVISLEEPKSTADFERIFKLAEDRDTPIAIGSISILNASWRSDIDSGTVIAEYDAKILNFDESLLSVEVLSGGSWVTPETIRRSDGKVEFFASSNVTFRLTYSSGAVLSQEWKTTDPVRPPIEITNVYIDEIESGTGNNVFFTNMYWTAEFETQLDTSRVLQIQSWDMMMTAGGRTYGNGSRDYLSTSGMKIEKIGVGKYRIRSGIIFDTPPSATAVGNAIITYRPFGIDSQAFVTTKPIYRISLDDLEVVERIDEGETKAYVFSATIRTNGLPDDEVETNASMKLRNIISVYDEIITPESQSITKTGEGRFSIRAKFSGFNKDETGDVYAHVGVTCGQAMFWILQFAWSAEDPLVITGVTRPGPREESSIAYTSNIEDMDPEEIAVQKFVPEGNPTAYPSADKWADVEVIDSATYGTLLVAGIPARYRLVYASGEKNLVSKPFSAAGSVSFVDVVSSSASQTGASVKIVFDLPGAFDTSKLHVYAKVGTSFPEPSDVTFDSVTSLVTFSKIDGAEFYMVAYDLGSGGVIFSNSFIPGGLT